MFRILSSDCIFSDIEGEQLIIIFVYISPYTFFPNTEGNLGQYLTLPKLSSNLAQFGGKPMVASE